MAKKDQNDITSGIILPKQNEPDSGVESSGSEMLEYLNEITNKVYSTDDVEVKTELNDKQIISFSRANTYANIFNIPVVKELLKDICVYSISKNRKSRKEFTQLAQGLGGFISNMEAEPKSIKDNLMGR